MTHSDDLNNELISAYFDGEATPDEAARAEALLQSHQGSREARAQFQRIRNGIKALPERRLRPDFADLVLQQVSNEAPIDKATPVSARGRHWQTKWAVWASAAVAVVAAVTLIAVLPQETGELANVAESIPELPQHDAPDAAHRELPHNAIALDASSQRINSLETVGTGQSDQQVADPIRVNPTQVGTEAADATSGLPIAVTGQDALQALLFVELAVEGNEEDEDDPFAELLNRVRIHQSKGIEVSGGVQRVLLDLPCVKESQATVRIEPQQEQEHRVQLVYTIMLGSEVNRIQREIEKLPAGISGYDFSIGIRPLELADNEFILATRSIIQARKATKFFGQAKELLLTSTLFSPMTTGRTVFASLSDDGPKGKRRRPEPMLLETGADEPFEILFVVHRMNTVAKDAQGTN